ncbi:MAG: UDP-3-O-(3-hydroxymyristoyl)glucosamine N-acyltransferase [Betaproteobacteria bacterium]|jgi:UDP-3-O-[3-hydroxymyristoyl] glucosamine N-acyltransferase|nr:UDP-3-O-(3-hydroxymyristoyl)glucosamine N-acyltransferase [Betaproteobacteria bacterium]
MTQHEHRLGELAKRFGGEVVGGGTDLVIKRLASLRSAQSGDITFFSHGRYRDELAGTRASAVIVGEDARDATGLPRIVCSDPYLFFAQVARLYHTEESARPGVHASAVVLPGAHLAPDVSVGPLCVIEEEVEISSGSRIGPGCSLGRKVRIGSGARLHAGVTVYAGCEIGERTILHSGVVVGADGFGFAPNAGAWLKIPQLGSVRIGADVEIGANTTIDRGALDDTVIEDGVKLDNQIQIGHNVRIGAHTAIAGCVGIAGSTRIGSRCMIGGAAMIGGHLNIADRVIVAGGTVVTKSLDSAGTYVSVIPATPAREWRRTVAMLRNLERMSERLRLLERRLADLENEK